MVSTKLASALKKAKALGRGGDTMLAHINPREADLLKKAGGSGTVNPHTGLPEFMAEPDSSYGGGGYGYGQSNYGSGGGGDTSGGWSTGYSSGGRDTPTTTYRSAAAIDAATDNYGGGGYGVGQTYGPTPNSSSGASDYGGSWNSPSTYSGGTSVSNSSPSRSQPSAASSLGSALSAGAGMASSALSSIGSGLTSFSDSLNGILSSAAPTVNAYGTQVSDGLINASDALNNGIASGYNYAKNFISQALDTRSQPSYTQYASGGVGAPGSDYAMPNMGPPGLRSEAANGGYEPPSSFPSMVPSIDPGPGMDLNSYIGGSRLGGYEGSGNTVYSGFGNSDMAAEGASPAAGTVGVPGPGYAGPKGVVALNQAAQDAYAMTNTAPTYSGPKGVKALNDAAWAAGGGMTLDPATVANLRDKFGNVPVGIRTNNPGNILDGKFAKSQPGYDGSYTSPNGLTYAKFTRPDYGMMAQQELISGPNYYGAGRDTVAKIIDKYAPVDENNSPAANAAYKQYVAKQLGVGINDKLTEDQVKQMSPAQLAFELGGNPYNYGPVGAATTMMASNGSGFTLPGGGYAVAMDTTSPTADPNAQVQGGSGNYIGQVGTDFAHGYQLDTGSLVADIKQTVPGASWLSDSAIMDRVAQAAPEGVSIDPKTGMLSIGDVNKDGTVDAKDRNAVVEAFKGATGIDPSRYAVAVAPPAPNVDYNVNMGTQVASADLPAPNAQTVADAPPQYLPNRPVTPTPEWAYNQANPNAYASPLTLPAQPTPGVATAVNAAFSLFPGVGLLNTGMGLFGKSIGDMYANRENIPMTPEEAQAAENRLYAQGEGKGNNSGLQTFASSAPVQPTSDVMQSVRAQATLANLDWQRAAIAHGYSPAQLADPKVAALIKQIYDMGLIPKQA